LKLGQYIVASFLIRFGDEFFHLFSRIVFIH
jgi:hypothetical protein